MGTVPLRIRWAARLAPAKLERLYELDARGNVPRLVRAVIFDFDLTEIRFVAVLSGPSLREEFAGFPVERFIGSLPELVACVE